MRRGEREWKSGGRRAGRLPSSGGEDVPCLSQGKWFQFRSIKLTRRVVLRSSFLPSFLPFLSSLSSLLSSSSPLPSPFLLFRETKSSSNRSRRRGTPQNIQVLDSKRENVSTTFFPPPSPPSSFCATLWREFWILVSIRREERENISKYSRASWRQSRERRGRDEEAKRDRKHFDFVSSRFHFSRIARDGKDDERRGGGQGQSSERKRRAILTLREVNRPRRVLWILNCSTSAGSFVSMRFPPTSPPILNSVSKCCHRITFPSHRPLFNFQPDILLLLTYCPLLFRFTLCK